MNRLPILYAACLGLALSACAPPAPGPGPGDDLAARIDAYVEPMVLDQEFSGVVLVGDAESIRTVRSFGFADFENSRPNEADTRFRIASLTKTMTAAAVAVLLKRGEIALDEPVNRFLPGFPPAERITIRNLLRHESGVGAPDARESFETSIDLEGLVQRIESLPLDFEPGTENRYSNSGYALLAYIVQAASGMPYAEFLKREIFDPAGLQATGKVQHPDTEPTHARPYSPTPEGPQRPVLGDIGFSIGSGDLSSTVGDLYRWGVAIHRNQLFDMDVQVAGDWPYGWGKVQVGDHTGIEQTGALQGFMSSLAVFDDGTIVVMLLNLENGRWVPISRDLASIVFGEPYEIPRRRQTVELSPEALQRFPGRYTGDIGTMEVRLEDGHLWNYFNDWPVGKYLAPICEDRFAIPADNGEIQFRELSGQGYAELIWDFGESSLTFRR